MVKEGSTKSKPGSRFLRKSAKPGAKRKPRSILLLGAKNIGKTCLAKRFMHGQFGENHVATVEDRYPYDLKYKEYQIHTEIIDIDAFEFPAMRELCVKEASIIMFLYEVGNKKSFDIMKKIYVANKDVRDYPVPFVIVGTKGDKMEHKDMVDGVTEAYVEKFVDEMNEEVNGNIVRNIITSAKLGFNVNNAFYLGLDDVIKTMNAASLYPGSFADNEQQNGDCCCVIS